ncbi:MAG: DUF3604 domain-containing protein, partial [Deltaproteobacteria bacterium]|nr:DUF3604 domain-containing protein [Deltaproteobacteria bacterium]
MALALASVLLAAPWIACSPEESEREDELQPAQDELETGVLAPSGRPYSEARAACANRDSLRQAFWGELHVHSELSMDAWTWDVRGGPDEIYRFARGEEIFLPPLDESGKPTRAERLERPID